jgi:hypothetical protein
MLHLAEVPECRPLRGVVVLAHQGSRLRVVAGNSLDQACELVRRSKLSEALLACNVGVVRTEPGVRVRRDAEHAQRIRFSPDSLSGSAHPWRAKGDAPSAP